MKKKKLKKKTLAPTQLFIEKTNVSIPYENQSHFFSKPALATIPIDFFRTLITEHVFTKKTLMELPYFIEISLVFQYFPDSPYVSRFLFCNFMQKLMNNTFVNQFFLFLVKSPYVTSIIMKILYVLQVSIFFG